jgi:hypothetical protein
VTHLLNPIGATLVALLAALVLAGCGDDDSEGEERSAAEILRALPSGLEYRPVGEAEENTVVRQSMPEEAVEKLEDVEMRRVLRDGEVIGFAMAVVSGPELGEDDVLRGYAEGVGTEPRRVEIGGKDGRLASFQGFEMIVDVKGTEMVVVAALNETDARDLARPVLLD